MTLRPRLEVAPTRRAQQGSASCPRPWQAVAARQAVHPACASAAARLVDAQALRRGHPTAGIGAGVSGEDPRHCSANPGALSANTAHLRTSVVRSHHGPIGDVEAPVRLGKELPEADQLASPSATGAHPLCAPACACIAALRGGVPQPTPGCAQLVRGAALDSFLLRDPP